MTVMYCAIKCPKCSEPVQFEVDDTHIMARLAEAERLLEVWAAQNSVEVQNFLRASDSAAATPPPPASPR